MSAPKKLYIKTYGCQMNVYDSERMAETLGGQGYVETKTPDDADMILLNTCHIREKAAERAAGPRQKIQAAIEEARRTLEEGQEGRDIGGGLMVIGQSEESIEKTQEIETKIRDLQREENKISRQQRAEIQAAINSYEWTNMLLTPTLVIIIGLLVGITRKFKTAAK